MLLLYSQCRVLVSVAGIFIIQKVAELCVVAPRRRAAGLERSRRLPRGPNPTQPKRRQGEGRGHCMGHCPHCSQAGFPAGRGPCPPSPRPAGTAMTPSIEILNLKLAPPASWNQACRRDHVERSQGSSRGTACTLSRHISLAPRTRGRAWPGGASAQRRPATGPPPRRGAHQSPAEFSHSAAAASRDSTVESFTPSLTAFLSGIDRGAVGIGECRRGCRVRVEARGNRLAFFCTNFCISVNF